MHRDPPLLRLSRPSSAGSSASAASRADKARAPPDLLTLEDAAANSNLSTSSTEWAQQMLRSITDLRRIGESDDTRLLPAIESWLAGRLPIRQFSRQVDSCDSHGSTLLMVSSCFGKVAVCRRLLAGGADPAKLNNSGRGALVYAAMGPDLPLQKSAILRMLCTNICARDPEVDRAEVFAGALQAGALLGRRWVVQVLASFGGLPPGQIVFLLPTATHIHDNDGNSSNDNTTSFTSSRSKKLAAQPLDLDRALGSVVRFEHETDCYVVDVLAVKDHNYEGGLRATSLLVGVDPSQLVVPLHHMGTEGSERIVAGGSNPLDSSAAVLAGAPPPMAAVSTSHGKMTPSAAAPPSADHPDDDPSVDMPPANGFMSSLSAAPSDVTELIGASVEIVGRPEQWLCGRTARVHSWDAQSGRFMVLIAPETTRQQHGGEGRYEDTEEASAPDAIRVPMLLRREHLRKLGEQAQP